MFPFLENGERYLRVKPGRQTNRHSVHVTVVNQLRAGGVARQLFPTEPFETGPIGIRESDQSYVADAPERGQMMPFGDGATSNDTKPNHAARITTDGRTQNCRPPPQNPLRAPKDPTDPDRSSAA